MVFSILLYHLVCWLGSKSSKVQTKSEEKRNMGTKTIEIMCQQSQIWMDTYLVAALFTGSDQPSPLRKLKERLKYKLHLHHEKERFWGHAVLDAKLEQLPSMPTKNKEKYFQVIFLQLFLAQNLTIDWLSWQKGCWLVVACAGHPVVAAEGCSKTTWNAGLAKVGSASKSAWKIYHKSWEHTGSWRLHKFKVTLLASSSIKYSLRISILTMIVIIVNNGEEDRYIGW